MENVPGSNFRSPATHVLIVADSPIVRSGLETLVRSSTAFALVGSLGEPDRLADYLARHEDERQPDLVLECNNSREPSLSSVPGPDSEHTVPAVVLTDDLEIESVTERLRAGVRAVLPRASDPAQILGAMEAAAAGLIVLHPSLLTGLVSGLRSGPRTRAPLQPLTPRELEVLDMLAEGLGNKTIAWKLGISEHTVKFHIAAIFDKLDVSSRAEAVAIGIRHGLIMI